MVDSSPGLSPHESRQHPRARIQGKGNINTPLELAINNNIDRFSLAMDVIDRVPRLQKIGGHAKERFLNQQIECQNYAHQFGIDKPEANDWCGLTKRALGRMRLASNHAHRIARDEKFFICRYCVDKQPGSLA